MHQELLQNAEKLVNNYGKSAKKKATGGVVKMKKGGEAKKTKNLGDKIEKYGNTAINTLTGMALGWRLMVVN